MADNYQGLQELVLDPSQVKPTYVHSECTAHSEIEKRDKRVIELDILLAATPDSFVDIAVIKDPQTGNFLVYTGNIDYAYALQHGRKLRAKIISNQEELDRYTKETGSISTLGVTDFKELLKDLRLSAQYPAIERDMPKVDFERLHEKQRTWQERKISRLLAQTPGWDDDDD